MALAVTLYALAHRQSFVQELCTRRNYDVLVRGAPLLFQIRYRFRTNRYTPFPERL